MKVYNSIIDKNIIKHFKKERGDTLMNFAANTCGIEETLAIASLFCPEIIEEKGYIFISEFYNGGLEEIEKQFKYNKRKVEMFVNSWSLADFFLQASDESVHKDEVIEEFGKVLQYFWDKRMKELFPDKEIAVELGDEIMGERGLTITVYQK